MIKTILLWLWTQIRSEMAIQKPAHAPSPVEPKTETRQDRIAKTGMNGFAMIVLVTVVVGILVL